jgi:hypothetical protein
MSRTIELEYLLCESLPTVRYICNAMHYGSHLRPHGCFHGHLGLIMFLAGQVALSLGFRVCGTDCKRGGVRNAGSRSPLTRLGFALRMFA